MTRRQLVAIAVCVTAALVAALGFMPKNWVELWFGIDPDGGSGVLESLLIAIPATTLLVVAAFSFWSRRTGHSDADEQKPAQIV